MNGDGGPDAELLSASGAAPRRSTGKMNSAMELRMNTVPSETDISSSVAPITGPTAAIALPPQIAVPDEIRCAVPLLTRSIRPSA